MSFSLTRLKKTVSLLTLIAFIFTNALYAAPSSRSLFKNKKVDHEKLSTQREDAIEKKKSVLRGEDAQTGQRQKSQAKQALQLHLKDLSQIHVPSEYGRVIEVYDARDTRYPSTSLGTGEIRDTKDEPRLIVHIQDLHTNPEAELNLANILELLIKDYNLDLVCSEGADGVVDTSSVSSFPDYDVREKTARLFINSGELTGEEYLSITKYPDLAIWGIEDRDIYFENIVQFNKIMKFSPDSQVFISRVTETLNSLKPKIYSKKLLEIDQKETDYENQEIETNEYLEYLLDVGAQFTRPERSRGIAPEETKYKNITLLTEATKQEKTIDQAKIMQESQSLLLNLQSALQAKRNKSEIDSLMVKAELFKDQKISPFSFYNYLKDLASKHIPDQISKYPSLNNFIDYLTKVNSLDSVKLFNEMEELSYEVKLNLAKTEKQQSLIKALRNINFLEGFFNLKVSNEELDHYLANKDSHKVAFFKSIITELTNTTNLTNFIDYNPSLIDDYLQELEDFYSVVKKRDIAMVTNSLSEIEKRNAKVSALVSGGFHTKGITTLLREKGHSYIVVSPYSSTEIDEGNYHFLLSGKRRPISELIEEINSLLRVALPFASDDFIIWLQDAHREAVANRKLEELFTDTRARIEEQFVLADIRLLRRRGLATLQIAERLLEHFPNLDLDEIVGIDGGNTFYVRLGDTIVTVVTREGIVKPAVGVDLAGLRRIGDIVSTRLARAEAIQSTAHASDDVVIELSPTLASRDPVVLSQVQATPLSGTFDPSVSGAVLRGRGSPYDLLKYLINSGYFEGTTISMAELRNARRDPGTGEAYSDSVIYNETNSLIAIGVLRHVSRGNYALTARLTIDQLEAIHAGIVPIINRRYNNVQLGLDRWRLDDLGELKISAIRNVVARVILEGEGIDASFIHILHYSALMYGIVSGRTFSEQNSSFDMQDALLRHPEVARALEEYIAARLHLAVMPDSALEKAAKKKVSKAIEAYGGEDARLLNQYLDISSAIKTSNLLSWRYDKEDPPALVFDVSDLPEAKHRHDIYRIAFIPDRTGSFSILVKTDKVSAGGIRVILPGGKVDFSGLIDEVYGLAFGMGSKDTWAGIPYLGSKFDTVLMEGADNNEVLIRMARSLVNIVADDGIWTNTIGGPDMYTGKIQPAVDGLRSEYNIGHAQGEFQLLAKRFGDEELFRIAHLGRDSDQKDLALFDLNDPALRIVHELLDDIEKEKGTYFLHDQFIWAMREVMLGAIRDGRVNAEKGWEIDPETEIVLNKIIGVAIGGGSLEQGSLVGDPDLQYITPDGNAEEIVQVIKDLLAIGRIKKGQRVRIAITGVGAVGGGMADAIESHINAELKGEATVVLVAMVERGRKNIKGSGVIYKREGFSSEDIAALKGARELPNGSIDKAVVAEGYALKAMEGRPGFEVRYSGKDVDPRDTLLDLLDEYDDTLDILFTAAKGPTVTRENVDRYAARFQIGIIAGENNCFGTDAETVAEIERMLYERDRLGVEGHIGNFSTVYIVCSMEGALKHKYSVEELRDGWDEFKRLSMVGVLKLEKELISFLLKESRRRGIPPGILQAEIVNKLRHRIYALLDLYEKKDPDTVRVINELIMKGLRKPEDGTPKSYMPFDVAKLWAAMQIARQEVLSTAPVKPSAQDLASAGLMITVDEALAGGMLAKRYDKIAFQIAQGQIDIDTFLQVFTFFLISDDNALMANTIEFLESGHLLESSGVGPEAIRRLEALLDDANNGAQLAQRIKASFIENRALWAPMPNETILSHSRRYPEVADAFAQGLANLTIEEGGNLVTRAASMLLNMARHTGEEDYIARAAIGQLLRVETTLTSGSTLTQIAAYPIIVESLGPAEIEVLEEGEPDWKKAAEWQQQRDEDFKTLMAQIEEMRHTDETGLFAELDRLMQKTREGGPKGGAITGLAHAITDAVKDLAIIPVKLPKDIVRKIVSENIAASQILDGISDDEITDDRLMAAKADLQEIIAFLEQTEDYLLFQRRMVTFSKGFNYLFGELDRDQREIHHRMILAKSVLARDVARRYLDAENADAFEELTQNTMDIMEEFIEDKIAVGDLKPSERDKIKEARKFINEWLTEPNIPQYIKQGIIRGMLEGRSDDLIYAFGNGWRQFGTAGIRNQAVNSSFASVLLLELEEFAQNAHAPVLGGPNLMNAVTLLQQTATVKHIITSLQAYITAYPDATEVNLRDLMQHSKLFERAQDRGEIRTEDLPSDVVIALPEDFKENLRNNSVTFSYDSRLNGKYWAHVLAADLLDAGIKVNLFENVSGMPSLVIASRRYGSIFGFLISASHSEPNYNGFKFAVGHLMSQVDKNFQKTIMAFRNMITYDDIELSMTRPETDPATYLRQHSANLTWLGKEQSPEGHEDYGAERKDFYTETYEQLRNRSPLAALEAKDPGLARRFAEERDRFKFLYTAFSGAGARDAEDPIEFLRAMGYEMAETVKAQTDEVDGRFPAFIKGWITGMPDPGNIEACAANLAEYILQIVGDDLSGLAGAIDILNNLDLFGATDPDSDRAGMVSSLDAEKYPGATGNMKALIIAELERILTERGYAREVIEGVKVLLDAKLYDKLHLTANDAWAFLSYWKLRILEEQGMLEKDKLYVIIKSHVTTSGLEGVAEYYRKRGYNVHVVDTFVGFTLLAERADALFNFAKVAWEAASRGDDDATLDRLREVMPQLEKMYTPLKGQIQAIDDATNAIRTVLEKGQAATSRDLQEALRQLKLVANIDVVCGVEESNGYGEFGEMQLVKGKEAEVVNEHIREKDGSLALYEFMELMVYLKVINKPFHTAYLEMMRDAENVTATTNSFDRYVGAAGEAQKVGTIQAIEKELAFFAMRELDHGEEISFFDRRYVFDTGKEPVEIFWGNKYDNNFSRFPEEGIRFNLITEYRGTTYRITVTYRPSGTGMENRDYNWAIGVVPAGSNLNDVEQIRRNVGIVRLQLVRDFFGDEGVKAGYFERDEFGGILLAMNEGGFKRFREVFAGALGIGVDEFKFTEQEEGLVQGAMDFAFAARELKGRVTPEDRTAYDEKLRSVREENSGRWKRYFESHEARRYPKKVEVLVNGKVLAEVPKSMAISWSASLTDYLAELIKERYGLEEPVEITCEVSDLAKLTSQFIDERLKQVRDMGNLRLNNILAELDKEDMRGQLNRLYGRSYEEAEALNASKMAEVGFETKRDGTKVNRLGWTLENVKSLLRRPDKVQQVLDDAATIRSRYKYVIFCGMGGSGLSVQTVKTTFGEPEGFKMFSLRTTDPAVIKDILDEIAEDAGSLETALSQTLVIPISKSGTTQETVSHKEYFEKLFTNSGMDIKDHMWVITDKGSPMDTGEYEQRPIQLNERGDIGGRFTSPTTRIFLLPLALVAPERIEGMLNSARAMNEIGDINEDTFMNLGVYLYHMAAELGKDKVTFMVPEELRDLPMWSEQLFEESLGKDGKGVTIFYGEDISEVSLKDVEENDRVFLRVNVAGKKTNDELWNHLKENGYPVFEIDVDDIDSIGGVMLGLQRTVATVGYLWDICFVDQPAVEGYKNATREVMASLEPGEKVEVPRDWKYVSFNGIRLYYDRLIEAGAFTQGELEAEVQRLGSTMNDAAAIYAAIINILKSKPGFEAKELTSYGRMTQGIRAALERARKVMFTDGLKMPSKLGEGPDKNHSYHQNIEDGKDMWFSTYFMPLNVEQPEVLEYDDNLIRAQTIGTVNSIVNRRRKVALITLDSTTEEAEEDVDLFFRRVGGYLAEESLTPVANPTFASLAEQGHVVSKDFITPEMIKSGQLERQVRRKVVHSVTTNPSSNAGVWKIMVDETGEWVPIIEEMVKRGMNAQEIYDTLFIENLVVPAMKIFAKTNRETNYLHGYVSYEFRPKFTADPDITKESNPDEFEKQVQIALKELKRLDKLITEKAGGLHNFFIKVPATHVGIEAGKRAIAALGININYTLIATEAQYTGCVNAYKEGVREYIENGQNRGRVNESPYAKSVASDFVSRTDRSIDPLLSDTGAPSELEKQAGLAYAIGRVYRRFEKEFKYDEEWNSFAKANGVPIQQIYWGSTGVKVEGRYTADPHYAGPLRLWGTTNTAPPDVVDAIEIDAPFDGDVELPDYGRHEAVLAQLDKLGISVDNVQENVYRGGLVSFAKDDAATFEGIGGFIDRVRGQQELAPPRYAVLLAANGVRNPEGFVATIEYLLEQEPDRPVRVVAFDQDEMVDLGKALVWIGYSLENFVGQRVRFSLITDEKTRIRLLNQTGYEVTGIRDMPYFNIVTEHVEQARQIWQNIEGGV